MAVERWLVPKWQDSPEALDHLNLLLRRNKRRQFGLLEEPAQGQSGASVIRYKILLWGKAGVGKTSTIAKLCGLKVPPVHYETPGIRVSSTFWPAKLERQGKVVFFRFDFWDVGDKACAKFDHILPACKAKLDAVMFLFSFTDRASFEDLPNQMSQLLPKDSNVLKLIVGTRFDLFSRSDVAEGELRTFAQQFEIPILRIRNVDNVRPSASGVGSIDGKASLLEVAPLMNTLGDFLLQRDQRMANPRSAASSSVSLPLANIATALPRAPHQQAPHMERGGGGGGSGGRHGGADDKRQHGSSIAASAVSGSNPIGPNKKQSSAGNVGSGRPYRGHAQPDDPPPAMSSNSSQSAPSDALSRSSAESSSQHTVDRPRHMYVGHGDAKMHSLHQLNMHRQAGALQMQRHGDPNIVQRRQPQQQSSLGVSEGAVKRRSGNSLSPLDHPSGGLSTSPPGAGVESSGGFGYLEQQQQQQQARGSAKQSASSSRLTSEV